MALISSTTLISALSLFHLTLAYFFLTNPQKMADQNLVFILGAAITIPHSTKFMNRSGPSALLGVVFGFLGLTDLVAVGLPEEIGQYHWGNQAPIRVTFFFGLAGYTYYSSLSNPANIASADANPANKASTVLSNSAVFSWAFIEMVNWFWVLVTLRDERQKLSARLMEKMRAEEGVVE